MLSNKLHHYRITFSYYSFLTRWTSLKSILALEPQTVRIVAPLANHYNVVDTGSLYVLKAFNQVQNSSQRGKKRYREWTLGGSSTDSGLLCKSLAYLYRSANGQLALQLPSRRLSQTLESRACRFMHLTFRILRELPTERTGFNSQVFFVRMPATFLQLAAALTTV